VYFAIIDTLTWTRYTIDMNIIPIKTPLFQEGDDLSKFIFGAIVEIIDKSVVVVTSKIVALSQNAVAPIEAKNKLIYKNSKQVIKTPWTLMALVNNEWCANAGIDESNAAHGIILLPKKPMATAYTLRQYLLKKHTLKNLGVIITDTRSVPLRKGTIGRAIGYAGFEPMKSYIGKKDLYGRKTRYTQTNSADALAAAAVCVMGEGNEQNPLAIITNAPVTFTTKKFSDTARDSLALTPSDDIYGAVFIHDARASRPRTTRKHS